MSARRKHLLVTEDRRSGGCRSKFAVSMDVNGSGCPRYGRTASAAESVIGMRVCELSNVSCGFVGKSSSFRPPQHHDEVNINFLTSGVIMRLQPRCYGWKVARFLAASTLLTLRCCIRCTSRVVPKTGSSSPVKSQTGAPASRISGRFSPGWDPRSSTPARRMHQPGSDISNPRSGGCTEV